jgi:hypothetical protein
LIPSIPDSRFCSAAFNLESGIQSCLLLGILSFIGHQELLEQWDSLPKEEMVAAKECRIFFA